MADVKISALPAASALTGTEVLPVVQSGTTDKATVTQVATYARSVTTKADVGLGSVDNTSDATKNSAVATLTNKTLTAPVVNSPTGIVKADVGLGNVDNTSNATERAATATLTNKTLTAPVINSPTGITATDVGAAPVAATYIVQTASAGLSAEQALGALASGVVHNTTTTGVLSVSAVSLATEVTGDLPLANIAQGTALSLLGVAGNATADYANIAAASDGQVFRRSGTTVGFGAVDLAVSAAVTGLLPDANLSANVPLLNGTNIFTANQRISSAEPREIYAETDAAADEKLWDFDVQAKTFTLRTRTDADGAGVNILSVVRGTGTALASMVVGNSANSISYTFQGANTIILNTSTGGLTLNNGGFIGLNIEVNGNSISGANARTYRPGSNRWGVATSATAGIEVDAVQQLKIIRVGAGLSVAEGSNAKMGVATLVGGTVVVSTTAVTANSRIYLTQQSLGTVAVPSGYGVSARTAGTSFTILASAPTDTSVIAWMLVEPS